MALVVCRGLRFPLNSFFQIQMLSQKVGSSSPSFKELQEAGSRITFPNPKRGCIPSCLETDV